MQLTHHYGSINYRHKLEKLFRQIFPIDENDEFVPQSYETVVDGIKKNGFLVTISSNSRQYRIEYEGDCDLMKLEFSGDFFVFKTSLCIRPGKSFLDEVGLVRVLDMMSQYFPLTINDDPDLDHDKNCNRRLIGCTKLGSGFSTDNKVCMGMNGYTELKDVAVFESNGEFFAVSFNNLSRGGVVGKFSEGLDQPVTDILFKINYRFKPISSVLIDSKDAYLDEMTGPIKGSLSSIVSNIEFAKIDHSDTERITLVTSGGFGETVPLPGYETQYFDIDLLDNENVSGGKHISFSERGENQYGSYHLKPGFSVRKCDILGVPEHLGRITEDGDELFTKDFYDEQFEWLEDDDKISLTLRFYISQSCVSAHSIIVNGFKIPGSWVCPYYMYTVVSQDGENAVSLAEGLTQPSEIGISKLDTFRKMISKHTKGVKDMVSVEKVCIHVTNRVALRNIMQAMFGYDNLNVSPIGFKDDATNRELVCASLDGESNLFFILLDKNTHKMIFMGPQFKFTADNYSEDDLESLFGDATALTDIYKTTRETISRMKEFTTLLGAIRPFGNNPHYVHGVYNISGMENDRCEVSEYFNNSTLSHYFIVPGDGQVRYVFLNDLYWHVIPNDMLSDGYTFHSCSLHVLRDGKIQSSIKLRNLKQKGFRIKVEAVITLIGNNEKLPLEIHRWRNDSYANEEYSIRVFIETNGYDLVKISVSKVEDKKNVTPEQLPEASTGVVHEFYTQEEQHWMTQEVAEKMYEKETAVTKCEDEYKNADRIPIIGTNWFVDDLIGLIRVVEIFQISTDMNVLFHGRVKSIHREDPVDCTVVLDSDVIIVSYLGFPAAHFDKNNSGGEHETYEAYITKLMTSSDGPFNALWLPIHELLGVRPGQTSIVSESYEKNSGFSNVTVSVYRDDGQEVFVCIGVHRTVAIVSSPGYKEVVYRKDKHYENGFVPYFSIEHDDCIVQTAVETDKSVCDAAACCKMTTIPAPDKQDCPFNDRVHCDRADFVNGKPFASACSVCSFSNK